MPLNMCSSVLRLALVPLFFSASVSDGASSPRLKPPPQPVWPIVRANILTELLPKELTPVAPLDAAVTSFIATLNASDAWPDVNYTDASKSWWFAAEHLRRTLLIATAWRSKRSIHASSTAALYATHRALGWWLAHDPQNQWWWMDIGVPRILAKILLLAPNASLTRRAIPFLDHAPLTTSRKGCNRVWYGTANILRGALEQNDTRIVRAFEEAYKTMDSLHVTSDDGVQHDGSFHQHGLGTPGQAAARRIFYSGWGYGAIMTTNLLILQSYARGTTTTVPSLRLDSNLTRWAHFAHHVLDGQQRVTRGANFDWLACGRLFTYFVKLDDFGIDDGHYHYFAAFSPFEIAFPSFTPPFTTPISVLFQPYLDLNRTMSGGVAGGGGGGRALPPRAAEFATFAKRLVEGEAAAPRREYRYYYDSDFAAYHRPLIGVTVNMFSIRVLASECVNAENKRGRTMADGAMSVYNGVNGNSYEKLFPVFNWTLVPGTTEIQDGKAAAESDDAACENIRKGNVANEFVGGVSDGVFGAAAMDFARETGATAAAAVDAPCNITVPITKGFHCDISSQGGAVPVPGTAGKALTNASLCEAECCANPWCNCWTWTANETKSKCGSGGTSNINSFQSPCCYLKISPPKVPLARAEPYEAGGMIARPAPAPTPAPVRCVEMAKSYFFLDDDVVVCLGAGLRRGGECSAVAATTSVQQANLVGPVYVDDAGAASGKILPSNASSTDASFAFHDGVVYAALPLLRTAAAVGGAPPSMVTSPLHVGTQMQTGSQARVTQGDDTPITRPVFTAFFTHPPSSSSSSSSSTAYAYAVFPAETGNDAAARAHVVRAETAVVVNVADKLCARQAVCQVGGAGESALGLLQAVLRGITPVGGGSTVTTIAAAQHGCWDVRTNATDVILMVRRGAGGGRKSTTMAVSLAFPTILGGDVDIVVNGVALEGAGCVFDAAANVTTVTVRVNATLGATSTVECEER